MLRVIRKIMHLRYTLLIRTAKITHDTWHSWLSLLRHAKWPSSRGSDPHFGRSTSILLLKIWISTNGMTSILECLIPPYFVLDCRAKKKMTLICVCQPWKSGITLWCYTCVDGGTERPSKKCRSLVSEDKAPPPKWKDGIAEKSSKVELTEKKLKDKHGSKFSIEQFNAWPHMIGVGKHCALKNPPNLLTLLGKHDLVDMMLLIPNMCLPLLLTCPFLLLVVVCYRASMLACEPSALTN